MLLVGCSYGKGETFQWIPVIQPVISSIIRLKNREATVLQIQQAEEIGDSHFSSTFERPRSAQDERCSAT